MLSECAAGSGIFIEASSHRVKERCEWRYVVLVLRAKVTLNSEPRVRTYGKTELDDGVGRLSG